MSETSPDSGIRPLGYGSAAPTSAGPSRAVTHPVLIPDPGPDDEGLPSAPTARAPQSLLRVTAYVAAGLGGAMLAIIVWTVMGARPESPPGARAGSTLDMAGANSSVALLDRRADTLGLALDAFSTRAGMFDAHRMGCAGLARGLQQVENGWVMYNVARKEALAALDSTHEARDRALYADVRAMEVRFERSSCARP